MPHIDDDDDELIDPLQSGDTEYLIRSLRKVGSISGQSLEFMAKLLEADPELRSSCKKRLGFLSWKKQKRLLPNSRPQLSSGLQTALNSADSAALASVLRDMQLIEGEVLETIRSLFAGDRKIKPFFKKHLGFVGWGRGRPALDPGFRETEDRNAARMLARELEKEGKIANAVKNVSRITEIGETRLWDIWRAMKGKHHL